MTEDEKINLGLGALCEECHVYIDGTELTEYGTCWDCQRKVERDMSNKLTKEEEQKLSDIMDYLEKDAREQFHRSTVGAFATASVYEYDEEIVDIELVYGIQSDCENVTYSENIQVDRETMEVID
jgi:hypothetical protein